MPDLKQLEAEQLARQLQAEQRAKDARDTQQRRLREFGLESRMEHGQKLFSITLEAVAKDINDSLEFLVLNPRKAQQHASAMVLLQDFSSTQHIAAVALTAAIDQMSKRQRLPTFLQHLGVAIERECRLIKLGKRHPLEMRRLIRTGMTRKEISSKDVMRALNCPVVQWDDRTRLQVGSFLSEAIFRTELLTTTTIKQGFKTPRLVVPTEQAEEFIRNTKPRHYNPSHLAMLVPPRDWPGLFGGGLLENDLPLIKVVLQDTGEEFALDHYKAADLSIPIAAVNHLQRQRLRVSGPIVEAERITWEGGWHGLWPCQRNPPELPDRLSGDPTAEELKTRNKRAAAAHRDREKNRHRRVKIERGLQIAEEVADRVVYQAHYCDHRGRIYSNAAVSTQGPDAEKAQFSFAEQLPVNAEAFEWLLKGAAGHWGMSRCTWTERLNWGRQNIDQMVAAAEDPLGKPELWRGAKDPWQFLQACHGVREAQATGRTGVMVRLDQTCSGCGILAGLTRHDKVGRLTNLYGNSPQDLYTTVAEAVTLELTKDLQSGDQRRQGLAQLWLKRGVDRGLCKGPILRAPYGGTYMSLCDGLVDALEEYLGFVPLEEYVYRVSMPSKYLASIMWSELKAVISPVMEVKAWLRACCRQLLNKQKVMHWTSPSGWPMRVADREQTRFRVHTNLYGKKVEMKMVDQPVDSPLCATQANKGLAANAIHSFDAAYCQLIAYKCAEQSIPLLTTHDCFACHPANAGRLHEMLIWEFGQLYRKPLLAEMHCEMEENAGEKLPAPPVHNSMDPMAIGSNSYLFS